MKRSRLSEIIFATAQASSSSTTRPSFSPRTAPRSLAPSLNVSSVKAIVAKYVKKAGIRKRVSVHTLRHTFGAHKADKNMSLATLQALMGHKKKETTLKYIHLARTNLRKEMIETAL